MEKQPIKINKTQLKQIVSETIKKVLLEDNSNTQADDFKLKDLREWLNSIPEKYNNYTVVVSQEGKLTEEKNFRLDREVIGMALDPETKEALIKIEFNKDID